MQQLLLLLIAAIISSCSSLHSLPYEEPKAAVFESGENMFVVRFRGPRPHVCSVVDGDGKESGIFLAAKDGDSIDLNILAPGEYKIVVREGTEIVCVSQIRLR